MDYFTFQVRIAANVCHSIKTNHGKKRLLKMPKNARFAIVMDSVTGVFRKDHHSCYISVRSDLVTQSTSLFLNRHLVNSQVLF